MGPIIGVVARPSASSSREYYYINKEINDAIVKNGGIAIIVVPPTSENLVGKTLDNTLSLTDEQFKEIKKVIDMCDGIICPGGDDFYDYDLKIVKYCYEIDKPLLGICLGMQTMGCLFNGNMKDFSNSNHKCEQKYVHKVRLNKDSKLYVILKKEAIEVNSRHKSYIEYTDLDVVGKSSDNIIEAIEAKNKKFFIGVQWHPESMIEYDITENNLFSYFIDCCRGYI